MIISPAQYVIKLFGGAKMLAKEIGRTRDAVYKWMDDPEIGGCGGEIPRKAQHEIMLAAKRLKLPIKQIDLIIGHEVEDE